MDLLLSIRSPPLLKLIGSAKAVFLILLLLTIERAQAQEPAIPAQPENNLVTATGEAQASNFIEPVATVTPPDLVEAANQNETLTEPLTAATGSETSPPNLIDAPSELKQERAPSALDVASSIRPTLLAENNAPLLRTGITNLEDLNRRILLKELELERFSINFRKLNNVQGRWRGWRYFLSQEACSGATAGGLVQQLCDRLRISGHPYVFVVNNKGKVTYQQNRVNRGREEAGLVAQMVGQFIGGTGSGIELGINMYHEYKARKAGYSPKEGIRKVLGIKAELAELFAQRDEVIRNSLLNPEELAVAQAEGKVLRDLTDMGLREYVGFHSRARRFQAFQDSLYIFDILKNGSGAASNLLNLYSFHRRIPRLPGPAGVVGVVSSAYMMFTPMLSRGCGKLMEVHQMRALKPILDGTCDCSLDSLQWDQTELARLLEVRKGAGEPPSDVTLSLMACYERQTSQRQHQLISATRELRSGTRAATENVTVGFLAGSTKMALSVDNIIAGWKYSRFPLNINRVIQSGLIAYTSGSFTAVAENLRLRLVDEFNRHRLGKDKQLPMQVLGERLKELDAIEKELRK